MIASPRWLAPTIQNAAIGEDKSVDVFISHFPIGIPSETLSAEPRRFDIFHGENPVGKDMLLPSLNVAVQSLTQPQIPDHQSDRFGPMRGDFPNFSDDGIDPVDSSPAKIG